MTEPELYRDRWISCTDTHLVIRGYYFPLGQPKEVAYGAIREVTALTMGVLTGRGRIWGTASLHRWAHLDPRRPRKRTALVLDLGRRVKPFITPDDPGRVRAIIEAHRAQPD